jgi:hypothetical protein
MIARCSALVVVAIVPAMSCEIRGEVGAQPVAPPPPPAYVQPPAPPASPAQASGIEAGCSFNAAQLPPGAIGTRYQVSCPPGCDATGGLWGSDVYTSDSAICKAGIHAGAITSAGGVVVVQTLPGRPAYRGSARYGIQSGDYGNYGSSYAVLNGRPGIPAPPTQPGAPMPPDPPTGYQAAGPVIEAGCSYNANQIQDSIGAKHVVSCPSGCDAVGGLWGTDVYTADSAICKAAIHAGLLTSQGGLVAVTLDPGRPAYRGTARYGLQSADYGAYGKSYHLQRP